MKWLKIIFILNLFISTISTMHGRAYYNRERGKIGRDSLPSIEKHESKSNCAEERYFAELNAESKTKCEICTTSKPAKCEDIAQKPATSICPTSSCEPNRLMAEKSIGNSCRPLKKPTCSKEDPAEAAMKAAKIAEAELINKEKFVEEIQRQMCDLEQMVQNEKLLENSTEQNIEIIEGSRNSSQELFTILTNSLQKTNEIMKKLEVLKDDIQADMNDKMSALDKSKSFVSNLLVQLTNAKDDMERTEMMACKAAEAAHKARKNIRKSRFLRRRKKRRQRRYKRKRRKPTSQKFK